VDPAASLDALRDVRVRDGRIAEIGERLTPALGEAIVDARDAIVAPGFVDMHVHLRAPGFPEKETIATGTEAAVRGGFTTVACMPNTKPALDDARVILTLMSDARRWARCRIVPIGAITRGRAGNEPCDFEALAAAGAVAFSDDGDTVESERVLRDAARRARGVSAPFISHCMPEDEIVARDLRVAAETKKAWHIAHVSTAVSLELIRDARERGTRVTCEVTPHHLTFTKALFDELGAPAKVHPPLRQREDVEALRRGALAGLVDAFATDHAPHTAAQKTGDPATAAPGFSGLEIAIGAYAAALPELPLLRFVELLSTNPARILGLDAGTLAIGARADVTIFADRAWTVNPTLFASKGKSTPFAGRRLGRRAVATIVGGTLAYRLEDAAA
jgi:dihydroorotase